VLATGGLVLIAPGWTEALRRRGWPRVAAEALAVPAAAQAACAPVIAAISASVSLTAIPANLLAAPAVAPVMWLGTLAGVLGSDVAPMLNALAAFPLAYLTWLARAAAGVPHAAVPVGLSVGVVTALYGVLAAAALARPSDAARRWLVRSGLARTAPWTLEDRAAGAPAALRPRWSLIAPLTVLLAAGALAASPGPPAPPDGPTLSMLDVGQGDAFLLQDGERAALFDTGRPEAPLVAELRKSGVRKLDLLVLTHSSADHEGGLANLLAAMPVGMVLDGRGPGREHGGEGGSGRFEGLPRTMPRGVTERGQRFSVGRIGVEILWPPPGEERRGDPNLTATVALVRTRSTTALLNADAESPVTLPLDLPHVDVLKVAHHGSADDGLPELLAKTTPRMALIPVGRNTYGHPAPSTLQALRGIDVKRADQDGTVRVPLGP
jgi:competence protein ComEC